METKLDIKNYKILIKRMKENSYPYPHSSFWVCKERAG